MGCKDVFPDGHDPFYFHHPDALHPVAISLALNGPEGVPDANPFVKDVIYGLLQEIDALQDQIRTQSERCQQCQLHPFISAQKKPDA